MAQRAAGWLTPLWQQVLALCATPPRGARGAERIQHRPAWESASRNLAQRQRPTGHGCAAGVEAGKHGQWGAPVPSGASERPKALAQPQQGMSLYLDIITTRRVDIASTRCKWEKND
ncbi:hypothetical protein TARUN_5291 [Trichoderma arundinaceum]|uniref:Uncharacterized protein n=1 Tax=Trichoderma arundinaceum TaxID=490622 RepID=A0A395NM45_TRIAR|nr:hypothetical protein TARUN_5291 [Trichoderma arundinaceum]